MAGNTRGKLKEHLEGTHRNCNAIIGHIDKSLVLIAEHNPKLTSAYEGMLKIVNTLDELSLGIYAKI